MSLCQDLVLICSFWHTSHLLLSLSLGGHKQVCIFIFHVPTWQAPCVVVMLAVAQKQQQLAA